jgi:hypothetical protein
MNNPFETFRLVSHEFKIPVYVTAGFGWTDKPEEAKTWNHVSAKMLEYYSKVMKAELHPESSALKRAA